MAYATVSNVTALCQSLINRQAGAPATDDIQNWIDEGASVIDTALNSVGYGTPAASTAGVYYQLRNLNATYGAMMAWRAVLVSSTQKGETTVADRLRTQFDDDLAKLLKRDLSNSGLTHTSHMYIGGISYADKDTVESDSDRIMTTFRRGQFSYPGAGTTNATTYEDEQAS